MNPFDYLKKYGLKRACQVIWEYKLPRIQVAILARLTRNRPLDNTLIIESHNDFDCNGGALYDWLIENGYNQNIKIVWRLYHAEPDNLPRNVSCVPVYGPSWKKAWAICTAKWMTADCSVADKIRDDQISVYMTHAAFSLKETKGLVEVPPSVDYVLGLTAEMDDYFIEECGIDSSMTKLLHIGYPDLDRLINKQHSKNYTFSEIFNKKTILWMPTFRKGVVFGRDDSSDSYPYGIPLVDSEERLDDLNRLLNEYDLNLIIKLHPKQDVSSIESGRLNNVFVLTGSSIKTNSFDNYDLMLNSIALISDYSGAAYQFLTLDRPMAFVLSDLDKYKVGLIEHSEDYMPGHKVMSYGDLCDFIIDIAEEADRFSLERKQLIEKLYGDCAAGSCERLIKFLGINSNNELNNR